MAEKIIIDAELRNRMNVTMAVALVKNLKEKNMIKQQTFDEILKDATNRINIENNSSK